MGHGPALTERTPDVVLLALPRCRRSCLWQRLRSVCVGGEGCSTHVGAASWLILLACGPPKGCMASGPRTAHPVSLHSVGKPMQAMVRLFVVWGAFVICCLGSFCHLLFGELFRKVCYR